MDRARMNLFWKLKNAENGLSAAKIRNAQLLHENRLLREKLKELGVEDPTVIVNPNPTPIDGRRTSA